MDNELNNNVPRYKFPYKITPVEENLNEKLMRDFTGERTGFVQVGPQKWFFPGKYAKEAENIYNFPVRKDDVWIVTFPRSGTTMTQEMVWMIANDCDFETSATIPLTNRFPFLEFSLFVHRECKAEFLADNAHSEELTRFVESLDEPLWEVLQESKERRFIKTHLPFSLLPPDLLTSGAKIIYVARNVKDVAVSFYHLNRLFRTQGYNGDFKTYWDYFENNLQPWTPYWEHIKEGLAVKDCPNFMFLFYENIINDMNAAIRKIAKFLDKTEAMTEERTNALINHLAIDNFKNNPSVNFDALRTASVLNKGEESFIRKGITGSSKTYYDAELLERVNKWIERNLEEVKIQFPAKSAK